MFEEHYLMKTLPQQSPLQEQPNLKSTPQVEAPLSILETPKEEKPASFSIDPKQEDNPKEVRCPTSSNFVAPTI